MDTEDARFEAERRAAEQAAEQAAEAAEQAASVLRAKRATLDKAFGFYEFGWGFFTIKTKVSQTEINAIAKASV